MAGNGNNHKLKIFSGRANRPLAENIARHLGVPLGRPHLQPEPPSQRVVQVTHAIATKRGNFTPARRFEGQEVVAKAGTVLGHDDGEPVTTPYDDCVLVMPAVNRPLRAGVTVVRLGRLI